MMSGLSSVRRAAILLLALAVSASGSQGQTGAKAPMATSDRWDLPGWWPTKGTPATREYVGPAACTRCHSEIAAYQQMTPVFHAACLGRDSRIPSPGHDLKFSDGVYN